MRDQPLLFIPLMSHHPGLVNVASCRLGGVSETPFVSLNVGLHVGDQPHKVITNRQLLCTELQLPLENVSCGQQTHSSSITIVTSSNQGRGHDRWEDGFPETDGLITAEVNVPLMVIVADCAGISFYDPVQKVIGIVHAGWRGAWQNISGEMIKRLTNQYHSQPQNLLVSISPCIGSCCYEVGSELKNQFCTTFNTAVESFFKPVPKEKAKYYFDLKGLLKWQLQELGVLAPNITTSDLCTSCRTDLFFSHRAERGKTGRFGVIICRHDQ